MDLSTLRSDLQETHIQQGGSCTRDRPRQWVSLLPRGDGSEKVSHSFPEATSSIELARRCFLRTLLTACVRGGGFVIGPKAEDTVVALCWSWRLDRVGGGGWIQIARDGFGACSVVVAEADMTKKGLKRRAWVMFDIGKEEYGCSGAWSEDGK